MNAKQFDQQARGVVTGTWTGRDGSRKPAFRRQNQLMFGAADVLAALMAGDQTMTPKAIGFIYGTGDNPTLTEPSVRNQTWATLKTELAAVNSANIQIAPIIMAPQVVPDSSGINGDVYAGNSVILSATTMTSADPNNYGLPFTAPYSEGLVVGNYLYHAVLLARPALGQYTVIARLSLAENNIFEVKPAGFELSLDWQISFF